MIRVESYVGFQSIIWKEFYVHTATFDRNHKYVDPKCPSGKFCLLKSVFYVYKKSLEYIHKWDDNFLFLLISSLLH